MGKEMREAHFALATAKYHAGEFSCVQHLTYTARFSCCDHVICFLIVMLCWKVLQRQHSGSRSIKITLLVYCFLTSSDTKIIQTCVSDPIHPSSCKSLYIASLLSSLAAELHGLGRGGTQIRECRQIYIKALEALVVLASLQVLYQSQLRRIFILSFILLRLNRLLSSLWMR